MRVPMDFEVIFGKSVMMIYEKEGSIDNLTLNGSKLSGAQSVGDKGVRFKRSLEQAAKENAFFVQNVPVNVLERALEIYEQDIEENPVREIREASKRG
jgi:hypothetical protein